MGAGETFVSSPRKDTSMSTFDGNNWNNHESNSAGTSSSARSGVQARDRVGARFLTFLEGRPTNKPRIERSGRPEGGARFDIIAAALATLVVGGLFLDGWAHNHGKVDQSFFTPWHAILYSGFAIYALFLLVNWIRAYRQGYAWKSALPYGYGLALIGAGVFAVGGVLDLIWHTLFGIEADVQALLSPTHLILATGLFLMVTGPLRAAWARRRDDRALSWASGAPVLVVLALMLSMMMFFTQFAHPLVSPWAANNPTVQPVHGDLYVMRVDGSGQTRLTATQHDAGGPTWSPNGQQIAFNSLDKNGSAIYVMRANGAGLKRLATSGGDASQPAWSPDGRSIVYVAAIDGAHHIIVMSAEGGKSRQLTSGSADEFGPAWSPDGKQIIFESNRSGDFNLYALNADGKGQPTRLTTTNGASDFEPAWSPSGKQVAFVSTRDGNAQIYLMNANGSGQRRLTKSSGNNVANYGPAWSPDGKQIAFVTTRDGNGEIYLMDADGSHPVNLSNNAGSDDGAGLLAWARNGEAIAYGAVGHPAIDPEISTALGIASILLQAALLIGILLFALRRWTLPLGAATLIFTVSAILISFMQDEFRLVPAAILAGIAADALLFALRPAADRLGMLRLFAFAVPAIYFVLYFIALAVTGGIAWVIHLWFGAPVMAGIVGLFLSYIMASIAQPTATRTRGY
jgi:WD40 repeat protein